MQVIYKRIKWGEVQGWVGEEKKPCSHVISGVAQPDPTRSSGV